jgi:hypothetical protein
MRREERVTQSLKKHFGPVQDAFFELNQAVEDQNYPRIARGVADLIIATMQLGTRVLTLENARQFPPIPRKGRRTRGRMELESTCRQGDGAVQESTSCPKSSGESAN